MTKYATIIILVLRLLYQPSHIQAQSTSFTNLSPVTAIPSTFPSKITGVKASITRNNVVLNWVTVDNESADQFEIEKSTDGQHFVMAALVFGTDEPRNGKYEFYEKAIKQKVVYRIKLISKNKTTEYSTLIEVNPEA